MVKYCIISNIKALGTFETYWDTFSYVLMTWDSSQIVCWIRFAFFLLLNWVGWRAIIITELINRVWFLYKLKIYSWNYKSCCIIMHLLNFQLGVWFFLNKNLRLDPHCIFTCWQSVVWFTLKEYHLRKKKCGNCKTNFSCNS